MSHAMSRLAAAETVRQIKATGRLSRTFDQSGPDPWYDDDRAVEQFEADAEQVRARLTGERRFEWVGNNLTISQAVSNAPSRQQVLAGKMEQAAVLLAEVGALVEAMPREGRKDAFRAAVAKWDRDRLEMALLGSALVQNGREPMVQELADGVNAVRALISRAKAVSPSDRMTVYVGDLEQALGYRTERARTKGGSNDG